MTTRVRRLNEYGDLHTSGKLFVFKERAIGQTIVTRLRLFLGEYFRDITDGTPWFQKILGKYENLNAVEAIIRRRITRTEGVIRLLAFQMNFDLDTRELRIQATVLTKYGAQELDYSTAQPTPEPVERLVNVLNEKQILASGMTGIGLNYFGVPVIKAQRIDDISINGIDLVRSSSVTCFDYKRKEPIATVRADDAWVLNKDGLTKHDADTPRYDNGLLIEPTITNEIPDTDCTTMTEKAGAILEPVTDNILSAKFIKDGGQNCRVSYMNVASDGFALRCYSIVLKKGVDLDDDIVLCTQTGDDPCTIKMTINSDMEITDVSPVANGVTIKDYGRYDLSNGLYRYWFSAYSDDEAITPDFVVRAIGNNPSEPKEIAFLGLPQVEYGVSKPTSPILGQNATRNKDEPSIPLSEFNFNANTGTFVIGVKLADINVLDTLFNVSDDANNQINVFIDTDGKAKLYIKSSGTDDIIISPTAINNDTISLVVSYNQDTISIAKGYDHIATLTGVTLPTVSTLQLGYDLDGNDFNGLVKYFMYYPNRLSDDELRLLARGAYNYRLQQNTIFLCPSSNASDMLEWSGWAEVK